MIVEALASVKLRSTPPEGTLELVVVRSRASPVVVMTLKPEVVVTKSGLVGGVGLRVIVVVFAPEQLYVPRVPVQAA